MRNRLLEHLERLLYFSAGEMYSTMTAKNNHRFWLHSEYLFRHRSYIPCLVLLVVAILLGGCDSSGGNETVSLGTMRAQVDGDSWQATDVTAELLVASVGEGLSILATSSNLSIIQLVVEDSDITSGTYEVSSVHSIANHNIAKYCGPETGTAGCASEVAEAHSGKITIERIDNESVKGRFEFETDRVTVTDGKFNLPVEVK